MCSTRDNVALPTLGFPIRASAGHWLFSASPRLIAAVHALHRLLVPRHPPCALTILTVILGKEPCGSYPVIPVSLATVQFSKSAKRRDRRADARERSPRAAGGGPVSQNSTACEAPTRPLRTCGTCQVRSTCLVADRSRGERRGLRRVRRRSCWRSVPSDCMRAP
jgi:hypothetical protein